MSKITDSAEGMDCRLRLPGVCNGNPDTTVWAHSNRIAHGKGRSLKAHDPFGCYACYDCHAVYDRQRNRPAGMTLIFVELEFDRAMAESQAILIDRGMWDGVTIPERATKRPARSRKIAVVGLSALQRMASR